MCELDEEFFELGCDILLGDRILIRLADSELDYFANSGKSILEKWSKKFNREVVLMSDKREAVISELDIKLPAYYTGVASDALIFTSYTPNAWNKQWLSTFEQLEAQERPSVLLELVSGKQIWCNRQAADLLKLTPQQMLSINSFDTWLPGETEKLWSEVRADRSEFQIQYRVKHALSGQLIDMTSDNRILFMDGKYYRFSTALHAQNVA